MSAPSTPNRAAWEAALSAYEGAKAVCDTIEAIEKAGHDQGDAWDKASDIAWPLLEALLVTPAPDGIAMGTKARLAIEMAHLTEKGDSLDNPATLARLQSGDWSERTLAALYLDGLRLAFDPAAFLADLLAADLSVAAKPDGSVSELYFNADKPRHPDADAMSARFDDLTGHDRRALGALIRSFSK